MAVKVSLMIAGQKDSTARGASPTAVQRAFYFVLPVLVIVGALIAYKSSAALSVIGKVSVTGVFIPGGNVIPQVGASDPGVLIGQSSLAAHNNEVDKLEGCSYGGRINMDLGGSQRNICKLFLNGCFSTLFRKLVLAI